MQKNILISLFLLVLQWKSMQDTFIQEATLYIVEAYFCHGTEK